MVQVGEWSSRVLLITDLNSRIPVLIEPSRQRAVMAGDNSGQPESLYVPGDASLAVGDRVVTSGHGGMFPPGLPVGLVASVSDNSIRIQPFVDLAGSNISNSSISDCRAVWAPPIRRSAPVAFSDQASAGWARKVVMTGGFWGKIDQAGRNIAPMAVTVADAGRHGAAAPARTTPRWLRHCR